MRPRRDKRERKRRPECADLGFHPQLLRNLAEREADGRVLGRLDLEGVGDFASELPVVGGEAGLPSVLAGHDSRYSTGP